MYERFTDRSRKVMQLANQEAARFNHEYIGTEHMLLGLVKEGNGVAAHVLKAHDVDLRKIRLEVEKRVQSGPAVVEVVMGRLPHTPRAKKVIELAIESARELGNNYVGTEHLLLGLLREKEGVAAQVLADCGVTEEAFKDIYAMSKNPSNSPEVLRLTLLKEMAIRNQDFQEASKYRDQIEALRKEQKGTRDQAEEKLRLITCTLLLYLTDEQRDTVRTLAEINKIVGTTSVWSATVEVPDANQG
jgi:ATP-dependent Clp protease ATP-binding subunit ClpA